MSLRFCAREFASAAKVEGSDIQFRHPPARARHYVGQVRVGKSLVTGQTPRLSLALNAGLYMRNNTQHLLVLVAAAAMVGFFTNTPARGQGFDPAQFRERQMENYRERMDVKSDADWNKIEPLVGKVMDAQRAARMGNFGFGFGRGGGRGGRAGGDGDQSNTNTNRNRGGGTSSPEAEALQKAIDDKASPEELKSKLAKFREARKEKEAALAKAQEELRKALSPRQEAAAVMAGLLK